MVMNCIVSCGITTVLSFLAWDELGYLVHDIYYVVGCTSFSPCSCALSSDSHILSALSSRPVEEVCTETLLILRAVTRSLP